MRRNHGRSFAVLFFVTDASVFREITAVGEAVAGPRKDVRKAAERLISR